MKGADQLTGRRGDGPGHSGQSSVITGDLSGAIGRQASIMRGSVRRTQLVIAGCGDGRRLQTKTCGRPLAAGQGRKQIDSAQQPPEDGQPCPHFDLGQSDPFQTPGLQNMEGNRCVLFQPPSLWHFLTAAIGN